MNLHHLGIFAAIADAGSITAASDRLHISQPALSRELRAFEQRLGVVLFERHARGMHLTEPGTILREYAGRLFALEAEAEAAMREVASARRGRLVIGASNTIGTYVLPQALAAFRREHPAVDVSLFVGNTEQVSEAVADLRFALGFVEGPLHIEGLTSHTFREDEIVPVVAVRHPLARKKRPRMADLRRHTLLMRERGSGTRELIEDLLRRRGAVSERIMEFSNTEALKQAALHEGGVAWLPRISMTNELARGSLYMLPMKTLRLTRALKMVQRDGAYLSPVARAFYERLQAVAPKVTDTE